MDVSLPAPPQVFELKPATPQTAVATPLSVACDIVAPTVVSTSVPAADLTILTSVLKPSIL